jgi:hypothetical protein
MLGARSDEPIESASKDVSRVVWGLLLIWIGAALLLYWTWGVGLLGAGAILLAAQAYRRAVGLIVDRFGLVAGLVLVVCGVGNLVGVAIELVPLLCIVAGAGVLVSAWTAHRAHQRRRGGPDVHVPSHPSL